MVKAPQLLTVQPCQPTEHHLHAEVETVLLELTTDI